MIAIKYCKELSENLSRQPELFLGRERSFERLDIGIIDIVSGRCLIDSCYSGKIAWFEFFA